MPVEITRREHGWVPVALALFLQAPQTELVVDVRHAHHGMGDVLIPCFIHRTGTVPLEVDLPVRNLELDVARIDIGISITLSRPPRVCARRSAGSLSVPARRSAFPALGALSRASRSRAIPRTGDFGKNATENVPGLD